MIVNANSTVQPVTQIKDGITKHINVIVKITVHAKKVIVGILANVFVRTVTNTSVTEYDEIIIVMVNISTKKTNTIAINVTSTASINFYSRKVRDCHILHTVLLAITLLLLIIIICYHYAKERDTT